MASIDPFRAIFERLVETTEKKAQAMGKTVYKPSPKPKKERKCPKNRKLH